MNFYQLTKKQDEDAKSQQTKTTTEYEQNESNAAVAEITTKMTKKTGVDQDRKDSAGKAKRRPNAGLSSSVASVRRPDNDNNNNVDGHQNFMANREARETKRKKTST